MDTYHLVNIALHPSPLCLLPLPLPLTLTLTLTLTGINLSGGTTHPIPYPLGARRTRGLWWCYHGLCMGL